MILYVNNGPGVIRFKYKCGNDSVPGVYLRWENRQISFDDYFDLWISQCIDKSWCFKKTRHTDVLPVIQEGSKIIYKFNIPIHPDSIQTQSQ